MTSVTMQESEPAGLSVGRCASPTAQLLDYKHQEFCYTDLSALDARQLEQLLDHWKLEKPNLVLEILAGNDPHPRCMVTKAMLTTPELQPYVEEVRATLVHVDGEAADDTDDKVASALGNRLYEQMIQSLIALLRACQQTNSWITLQGGTSVAYPLLTDALSRCDARPVILICENRDWYKGEETTSQLWDPILSSAKRLTPELNADLLPVTALTGWSQEIEHHFSGGISDQTIAKSPCAFATHFVFSKSGLPFKFATLAPKGTFYIGGGSGCAKTMELNVSKYNPSVFMNFTGRAASLFGTAILGIEQEKLATTDAVVAYMNERLPAPETEDCFDVCSSTKLYGYVTSLFRAYKTNPKVFAAVTVVLDSWTATPDEVLNKLSKCFGGGAASLEVGAADAKEQSIRAARDIYKSLKHSSGIFKKRADYMTVAGTLLSLGTTVASVASVALEMKVVAGDASMQDLVTAVQVLHPMTIVLPAIAGLIITALSRFRYLSKWGSLHMAMVQIDTEIWKYRTSSGEYDISGPSEKDDDKKAKNGKNDEKAKPKKDSNSVRKLFSSRVSQAYSNLLSGDMVMDSIHHPESASDPTDLRIPLLSDQNKGQDDGLSDLNGEDYFSHRVEPELRRLKTQAPKISHRLIAYEALILIVTLVTTLLATLGFKVYIPVAVAISGMLASFLQYEALQSRLAAVNSAISDLSSFSHNWAGMGVMERRGRLVKKFMVNATESAVLRVETSFSAAQATPSKEDAEDDDDKEKKEK